MKITTHKIKIPHTPRPAKPLEEIPTDLLKIPDVQPITELSTNVIEKKSVETPTENASESVVQPAIPLVPMNSERGPTDSNEIPPVAILSTTPQTVPSKTLPQSNNAQTSPALDTVFTKEPMHSKTDDVSTKSVNTPGVSPQKSSANMAITQPIKSDKKVLVDAKNICKSFYTSHEETKVLKNLSVQIHNEDFLIIVGPSGSGKSTLLHILLGLETPTTGELIFLEKDLYKDTTEDIRSEFRKQHIGMVYQQPNWIKSMSVLENIAFPLILRGYRQELAHEIAYGALQEVHMEMHANQPPTELSGGQQQRVSLARCIVHNPEIIVADEPTGNLDYESGQEVMQLLQSLNVKDKKTVIMVTHDIEYIKFANCAVQIFDGQVAGYYGRENLSELATKLHTKHIENRNPKETYDQKTN